MTNASSKISEKPIKATMSKRLSYRKESSFLNKIFIFCLEVSLICLEVRSKTLSRFSHITHNKMLFISQTAHFGAFHSKHLFFAENYDVSKYGNQIGIKSSSLGVSIKTLSSLTSIQYKVKNTAATHIIKCLLSLKWLNLELLDKTSFLQHKTLTFRYVP